VLVANMDPERPSQFVTPPHLGLQQKLSREAYGLSDSLKPFYLEGFRFSSIWKEDGKGNLSEVCDVSE